MMPYLWGLHLEGLSTRLLTRQGENGLSGRQYCGEGVFFPSVG